MRLNRAQTCTLAWENRVNVTAILDEMRTQQALIKECIVALERLVAQKPRRGRPPQWLSAARSEPAAAATSAPVKRGRNKAAGKRK
jgi:hypothetical protein